LSDKIVDKGKNGTITGEQARHDLTAHSLFDAARRYEFRIIELIGKLGYDDIRATHLTVLRNIDLDGTRMTELAKRAGITKQSMSDLVQQCEKLGLLKRSTDETDRRAKNISFTTKGLKLLEDIWKVVGRIDEEIAAQIGLSGLTSLRSSLKKYLS
jgi:DNA-binding MarR family transcriptional regulator